MNNLNDKVARYLIEQLAASGIAIMHHEIAYSLRRDIWQSPMATGNDFALAQPRIDQNLDQAGVAKYVVQFTDRPGEEISVAARSGDQLAKRIEWLTGRKVLAVEERARLFAVTIREPVGVPKVVDGEVLPEHACVLRANLLRKAGYTHDPKFLNKV